jgi:hypothetical protein
MAMSRTMQNFGASRLAEVITSNDTEILEDWIKEMAGATSGSDLIKDVEVRTQCSQFLGCLRQGTESGSVDLESPAWKPARDRQLAGAWCRTTERWGIN